MLLPSMAPREASETAQKVFVANLNPNRHITLRVITLPKEPHPLNLFITIKIDANQQTPNYTET